VARRRRGREKAMTIDLGIVLLAIGTVLPFAQAIADYLRG
jgi:hypothetical protein